MNTLLLQLTQLFQPYYADIATVVVATLLVIYGDLINGHLKRLLTPYHFLLRTLAFLLVCAFGYGALLLFAAPYFKQLMLLVPSLYQGVCLIGLFCLLGFLAQNRRYI